MGGKSRLAPQIVNYLESIREDRQFHEPFVGGANIVSRMTGTRFAYDLHEPLIMMYQAMQAGWVPPTVLTEAEHRALRIAADPANPLTAFAGFGCSFAGNYFHGYARDDRQGNYARQARNSLMRKFTTMADVTFAVADYVSLDLQDALIYCDPPYCGTNGWQQFDHDVFWQTMRHWSQNNVVVISEYTAPSDFECVRELPTHTEIRDASGCRIPRVERLFRQTL